MNSILTRLSIAFFVITLGLAVTVGWFSLRSAEQFVIESEQKLNRDLAATLSSEFQPFLNDSIDAEAIEERIAYLTGINPRIDIYLLGANGMIKAHFVPSGAEPVVGTLATEEMDAFLAGAQLPLLGRDPLDATSVKPFSVAPIEIMGEAGCYLYVVLGSDRYDTVASMLEDSFILQTLLRNVAIVVVLSILIGIVLFSLLTRRIRSISETVGRIEAGERDARVGLRGKDDLSQLGASIDHMAETLEHNLVQLEREDVLRRELVANVSHDLRSPLASIRGYLETILIKSETASREDILTYVQTAMSSSERLSRLVDDLFELSKLDANQVTPHPEPFNLQDLVQDVVMMFQPNAAAKEITLQVDTGEEGCMASGDIGLVERAMSNLIDNAIKYTPMGGTVTISARWDGNQVQIGVSDTGIGISEDDIPHIFDRFYIADKSRHDSTSGSTGLGLAIAKKIVELHDSVLSVQSRLNAGTTFSFSLPTV